MSGLSNKTNSPFDFLIPKLTAREKPRLVFDLMMIGLSGCFWAKTAELSFEALSITMTSFFILSGEFLIELRRGVMWEVEL